MPTPFFADLVREIAHEGGTGPLTPAGAVPGHRRFAGTVPPDTGFHYAIAGVARPEQWEVGLGRIGADARDHRVAFRPERRIADRDEVVRELQRMGGAG